MSTTSRRNSFKPPFLAATHSSLISSCNIFCCCALSLLSPTSPSHWQSIRSIEHSGIFANAGVLAAARCLYLVTLFSQKGCCCLWVSSTMLMLPLGAVPLRRLSPGRFCREFCCHQRKKKRKIQKKEEKAKTNKRKIKKRKKINETKREKQNIKGIWGFFSFWPFFGQTPVSKTSPKTL